MIQVVKTQNRSGRYVLYCGSLLDENVTIDGIMSCRIAEASGIQVCATSKRKTIMVRIHGGVVSNKCYECEVVFLDSEGYTNSVCLGIIVVRR